MQVGSKPRVVAEILTRVIGIAVDDDRVAVPDPVRAVVEFRGRHTECEPVKPEPARVTTTEAVDMSEALFPEEPPMLDWVVEMEPRFAASPAVANPATVGRRASRSGSATV